MPFKKKTIPTKEVELESIDIEEVKEQPLPKLDIPIPGQDFDLASDIEENVEFVDIPTASISSATAMKTRINLDPVNPENFGKVVQKNVDIPINKEYKLVSELINDLVNLPTPELIYNNLDINKKNALVAIFTFNFTTKFSCKLPDGFPPIFTKNREEERNKVYTGNLFNETFKFAYFIKETHLVPREYARNKAQTEVMLEEWLETLEPAEADLVVATKDKDLQTKYGITLELVYRIVPELKGRL